MRLFLLLLVATQIGAYHAQAQSSLSTIPKSFDNFNRVPHMYQPPPHFERKIRYTSGKRYCTIELKNDTNSIHTKALLNITEGEHFLIFKRKGKTTIVAPSKTMGIWYPDMYGNLRYGVAADSFWLFPINPGIITLFVPDPDMLATNAVAIQKGDGPVSTFSRAKVIEFVKDDATALAYAKKDLLFKAIEVFNNGESDTPRESMPGQGSFRRKRQ
jgi:hypothetical protein